MLCTTNVMVAVCHACTRRVQLSCVTLYTTSIVVVCHVLHDEYSGHRVSCCTRLV